MSHMICVLWLCHIVHTYTPSAKRIIRVNLSLSHTHTHTQARARKHTHTHIYASDDSEPFTCVLWMSHMICVTWLRHVIHTYTHSHTQIIQSNLSLFLSLAHTFTHTHTHTHTHTRTGARARKHTHTHIHVSDDLSSEPFTSVMQMIIRNIYVYVTAPITNAEKTHATLTNIAHFIHNRCIYITAPITNANTLMPHLQMRLISYRIYINITGALSWTRLRGVCDRRGERISCHTYTYDSFHT